jgi:hypothetical protein
VRFSLERMNATAWLLIEKVYTFVFYYRPVRCCNCARLILLKHSSPQALARMPASATLAVLLSEVCRDYLKVIKEVM